MWEPPDDGPLFQRPLPTPPVERRVRATDPSTSLEAAIKATKASREAVEKVREAFKLSKLDSSRVGLTDEELWLLLRTDKRLNYARSAATIRHARLALFEAGELIDSDKRRPTSDGCDSKVWLLALQP